MSNVFTGTYSSSFGTLKLKHVGQLVIGDYRNIGMLRGTYNEQTKTLTGFFINGRKKGRFSFKLTANGFDGLWAWGEGNPHDKWTGKRTSTATPQLENAYFEGTYETSYGEIRLQQQGTKIVGDFANRGIIEGVFDEKMQRMVATYTNKGKQGNLIFELTDDGFKGKWAWGNNPPSRSQRWNGTKISWKKPILSMYSANNVVHLSETQQRLNHLKAILKQNSLDELGQLGKLSIKARNHQEGVIVSRGFLTPTKSAALFSSIVQLHQIKTVKKLPALSSLLPINIPTKSSSFKASHFKMTPLAGNIRLFRQHTHISQAYWVADEITISDNTKIVFSNRCKHLFIIANKVTIGKNVQFTWQEPAYNNNVASQAKPQHPRQTKRPNRSNQVIHGSDKIHGQEGSDGADGVDAPHLQIWALDITGTPVILFKGQDGQDAQDGQEGGKGQNGANGINAKANFTFGLFSGCARKAGSGGNGASGGNGGDGGQGGNGGHGGKATFFVPTALQNQLNTHGFFCDLSGGEGGDNGRAGRGGSGGEGGSMGRVANVIIPITNKKQVACGTINRARNGRDGQQGKNGNNGRDGQQGDFYDKAIKLITIDEKDFNQQLNAPAITEIRIVNRRNNIVGLVNVGDLVSIEGLHFSATDTIKFNGVTVLPERVQTNTLTMCTIPDIEGGDVDVWIEQEDGTKSNPYTLVIQPQITTIHQQQSEGGRLVSGEQMIISGNGFSRNTEIFAERVKLSSFSFINNNEVHAVLVRPFPAHIPANNASGESIHIKARIPATREGTASSRRFRVTMDTFHMLVIGDSIQWGQGLQEHEKMHRIVEDEIKSTLANKMALHKAVLAHSGATIGQETPDKNPKKQKFHGEINVSSPTIREQVNIALAGKDKDDTVDLVLLDGGINDVGAAVIVNPKSKELTATIKACCYDRMKSLLEEVTTKFPKAKIIVTGYYAIVSERSDTDFIDIGLTALGLAVAGVAGAITGAVLSDSAIEKIHQNCLQFQQEGHQHINNAIADVMRENVDANGRIFFADPNFTANNAIFAPQALIFGVSLNPNPDFDLEIELENVLMPEDNAVIAKQRIVNCDQQVPDDQVCPVASCGHPTPKGATHYANSAITQLRVAMPELYDQ